MDTRLLDHDPVLGLTRLFHYDEATDCAYIETLMDATVHLEDNKAEYNEYDERARFTGDMNKVASIPLNVFGELQASQWITKDRKKMKQFLNDKDFRAFRTRPGWI